MQSLLIIGYVWPEPTATAAGSRMLQIIEQFKLAGYQITFASTAQKPNAAFDLSNIGVKVASIQLNNVLFDDFMLQLNPAIVLFDRFMTEEQFGWRVTKNCPNALQILDSEDLHFLRKARQAAVKKNIALPTGLIHTENAKREMASIYRCDVTLIISEFEMQYLQNNYQLPDALLWYLPFLTKMDNLPKPTFSERKDFIFIGNFKHDPNWDAVLHLKQTIWPLIKKQLPKADLHIYGAYPSEKVFQLHRPKDGFWVHGRADSVNNVMQQVRVCLVPLRFGAGLKGKIIDAMQNKTPFVTSVIGAEGMFKNNHFQKNIGFNDDDFVSKAVAMYTDKELWSTAQQKGVECLQTRFDKAMFQNTFTNQLHKLLSNIKTNRAQNFIGSMLQHHTLKSTMYLSKWIEAKNKL